MSDYIECKCPECGGEIEHLDTDDHYDGFVEDNYRCGVCDKLVVFVFDPDEFGIEWSVAPPYRVYTTALWMKG